MKRIIYILLILSAALNAYHSKGQSCPATPTYKNQSGTFELSSGRSIVLNSGATFQVTVQNTFYSDASICVTNGSTLNLQFQNVNTILKGGSIYVDATSKLTISGNSINSFPLTLTNAGTVTQSTNMGFTDGGTLINSGVYYMNSSVTLNGGTVNITNSGTFNGASSFTFNSGGTYTITNSGNFTFSNSATVGYATISNSGNLNFTDFAVLQGASVVTNSGYIKVSGNLSLSSATVNNNGVMYINGYTMINNGCTLNNTCTFKEYNDFSNNGTVSNTGSILLTVNGSSNFVNQGTFSNGTSASVQGTNFTNNSTVKGGGNFYFSGNTVNQGPFTGGDKGINFYDASNTTAQYFDTQNTTPTNTTKNKTSPNTATTFTSCSDATAPAITTQPATQYVCSVATTSAMFSVTATSNNTPTYQWYKNSTVISGANASSYTATGLTITDTANAYSVVVTNAAGSTSSSNAYVKYIIVTQPSPAAQYLATGNTTSFSGKVSNATSLQWQKDGSNISGATSSSYSIPTVNYADLGKYTLSATYSGGTCTSDAAVLKTSVVLYSKSSGNLNVAANWGVNTDGSGSTPVDFTRSEHTFIVLNRTTAETGADLTIAGTLDVANVKMTITPNTTLQANKVIRSLLSGSIASSSTASLTIGYGSASAAQSDLYFDAANNTLKNLTIAAKTVVLHSALNITSGKNYGVLQVNYGTFNTSDLLTLKSDSLGTAGVGKSAGTITGKVIIEKWMHARRAWRMIGAPIADATDAPTISAAWQEGATSSTANPAPGYGTHITGGTEANGFDISPTNNASLKVLSATGAWTGLSNTNKTPITQYPAYMLFMRGNRSYDIKTTYYTVAPLTTVLRVKGNLNQGTLAAKTVVAKGYTMVTNPYASPINFAKVISTSTNVKKRIRVWDPTLAGSYGVGAWVTVDGSTGTYRSTPPSTYVSSVLQAGQGFVLESADGVNNGSLNLNEDDKDFTVNTTTLDRVVGSTTDTSLEVNLKLFNDDSTTGIADGILYNFGARNNDSADVNDAAKLYNSGENIVIKDGSQSLAIDSRTAPKEGDSLTLKVSNINASKYQFEFVPSLLKNKTFALYDRYLNSFTPISATDTTHITFSVLPNIAASKAANRFTIVVQNPKINAPLQPVAQSLTFISVKAEAKSKAINVAWNVQNESAVLYYTVERSADGVHFAAAGNVIASAKGAYSYTDATPVAGINYYRIKSVSNAGSLYAPVVSGSLNAPTEGRMSIYPNPLTGATFTATLTDLTAGTYTLTVVNSNGTTVALKILTHAGGTASQKVTLNSQLTAGIYYIRLSSAGTVISTTSITAQ